MANNSKRRGDYFLTQWSDVLKADAIRRISTNNVTGSPTFSLFWAAFNVNEHVATVKSHKQWLVNSFTRFGDHYFPLVSSEQIRVHDNSKLDSFVELVGYTDRWVWRDDTNAWQAALQHHYDHNPHHPQFYINAGHQSNMEPKFLEESILDMIACRWERRLDGRLDASNEDIVDMDECFLDRYTREDKASVLGYLQRIRDM